MSQYVTVEKDEFNDILNQIEIIRIAIAKALEKLNDLEEQIRRLK